MRGNEKISGNPAGDAAAEFPIPMRGNEVSKTRMTALVYSVPDPHEG